MNTVNVSRGTGWIRVILAVACFAAVGMGVYLLIDNHGTVYWNLDREKFYAFIALYVVTFLAAVVGIISGVAAVRSPGNAPGWVLNATLLVFVGLSAWTFPTILGARAFLDL